MGHVKDGEWVAHLVAEVTAEKIIVTLSGEYGDSAAE